MLNITTYHDPRDYGPMVFVLHHIINPEVGVEINSSVTVVLSEKPLIKIIANNLDKYISLSDHIEYRKHLAPYCKQAIEALVYNYPCVKYDKYVEFLNKWV